ncbi:MAG TPA: hypothetical protein VE439_00925 [Anaerolineae bacterium]|nr:hypothetical protein [Anaerolineae bacterium]
MKDRPSNFVDKAVSEAPYKASIDFLDEDQELEEMQTKSVAAVWWEDITAYSRVEIPEDFEIFRLSKITVGLVWKETDDYLVLVQDYDLTNRGRGYRHNDFHIIPKGTIKNMDVLGEIRF